MKITRPTLLLNRSICQANINKMADKAQKTNVQLIPHFKTHQSAKVGAWFREAGVNGITVSSVKMAGYFAEEGWQDITIAFPVNLLELDEIEILADKVDLKIFINSTEVAVGLRDQLTSPIKFYIEIDVGDGRSGLSPENHQEISKVLELTNSSHLHFEGFYTHAGHTYQAASPTEVEAISFVFMEKLRSLKSSFIKEYPHLKLSLGDTPSCSVMEDFKGIDRIHPGNFVYYDLVQESLGSNTVEEIAICLAVPVVSVFPERQELIVHSGWVHQGKDSLEAPDGEVHYGLVVQLKEEGWSSPISRGRVKKISQEHGVIGLPADILKEIKVGDVLGILPVHACATAFMMKEVYTLEGQKLEMMP